MSLRTRFFALTYDRQMAKTEQAGLRAFRERLLAGAGGDVLEIGGGTGANLACYGPAVASLTITEPQPPMLRRLEGSVRAQRPSARVLRAPAEDLPFDDDSFDVAVSTLVLCGVDDQPRALRELRRVLRPGGRLLFIEHLRSGDPATARLQDRLNWLNRLVVCCDCNRPTLDSIRAAGFTVTQVEHMELPKAPPFVRPAVLGSAAVPAAAPGAPRVDVGRMRLHRPAPARSDPGHSVAVMVKPVLVVVDDEDASRRALARVLESRYGADYRIVPSPSPELALARLAEFRARGVAVPLVLADHWMPDMSGTEFLARVKDIVPTARRGLLVTWGDPSTSGPILQASALGQMEFYVPKPVWSPDEQFHRAITESLDEWWREQGGRFEAVTVIGEEPSVRTHEIRDILARNSVPFGFYRGDSAEGRRALARLGVDRPAGPVVVLFNSIVLVDPDNTEIAEALGVDVRPARPAYDVIIVGAGPAGLAAAVYAASEGLATVLLELEAFGGQAGTSSRIRNYLGFPRGISGADLAWRAYEQAWTFGTHFIYGNPATSLAAGEDLHVVGLRDGSQIRSRAVIIATGVSYRRLGIADLESLAGAGVFYGASTIEAQAVAGKPVFVVGGGNSAGQAALYLARYAEQVTLAVRSGSLAASMSDYLTREIGSAANVHVRYRSEVAGGGGDGRLEHLLIRDRDSGRIESMPAAGLFILIGAQPFTNWLPGAIARDRWGFILTGPDAAPHWPLPRAPFLFETATPGVFAVGDVRHGSVKRVASAVGEGSIAIRLVHDYLAFRDPGQA